MSKVTLRVNEELRRGEERRKTSKPVDAEARCGSERRSGTEVQLMLKSGMRVWSREAGPWEAGGPAEARGGNAAGAEASEDWADVIAGVARKLLTPEIPDGAEAPTQTPITDPSELGAPFKGGAPKTHTKPSVADFIAQVASELFTAERVKSAAPQVSKVVDAGAQEVKQRGVGEKVSQMAAQAMMRFRRRPIPSPDLSLEARQLAAVLRSRFKGNRRRDVDILPDAMPVLGKWA